MYDDRNIGDNETCQYTLNMVVASLQRFGFELRVVHVSFC